MIMKQVLGNLKQIKFQWVVKIKLPKKYVLTYDRTEADEEELAKGFQQGLDDETRQSGNAEATDI